MASRCSLAGYRQRVRPGNERCQTPPNGARLARPRLPPPSGCRRSSSSRRRSPRSSSSTSRRSSSSSSRRSGRSTSSPASSSTSGRPRTSRRSGTGTAYRTIALRTIGIAAAVTVADALLAFPFAYFMARVASRRLRGVRCSSLVLLPLWSSYLLRVYAWRLILDHDGLLNWSLEKVGLPAANIAYSNVAVWIVFSYIWLPFMIVPVYAALERIPHSTIEASRRPRRARAADVPVGDPAARAAGRDRRLDLHLRADPRRLHHARRSSAARPRSSSATSSTRASVSRTTSRSPRRTRRCRSS